MFSSLRRVLPVLAVLAFPLSTALSASAANRVHSEISRASHHSHKRLKHQKADKKRGQKGSHRSSQIADRKASSVKASTIFGVEGGSGAQLFGENAIQTQRTALSAGRADAVRFRSLTSGTAGSAHIYLDSSNTAGTVLVGIYSDAGGRPGALLSTGAILWPVAGAWNWAPITKTSVSPNTNYWLSVLGEGGTLSYRDRRRGSCLSATSTQRTLPSLPSAWGWASVHNECPISGFVAAAEEVVVAPWEPLSEPGSEPTSGPTSEPPSGPTSEPPSGPTSEPPPVVAPTDSSLPTVSGTATEGQTLSAVVGKWTGSPTSFAYQWQDCNILGGSCSDIPGATSISYTLGAGDVGQTVRVAITATNAGGSTSADSLPSVVVVALVPPAPTNLTMPAVSGKTTEGQVLSATTGAWTGNPTTYAYQWRDCNSSGRSCSSVSGATSPDYTLAAGDVNHTMRVMVTASNGGGSSSMSSPVTAPVEGPPVAAPANTVSPGISGTTSEGQTLTATAGSWTGAPTSFAYQWQDCEGAGEGCADISGATSTSYALGASDVGHTIRVLVTATNSGGSTTATSVASAAVAAVPPPPPPPPPAAPSNTVLPAISGTTTEGQTLTATAGSWTGTPTSFAYQWQDCNGSGAGCSNIGGATGSAYKLASSDVEHTVRVVVTATNEGGSTSATSQATAKVAAVVVNTGCTTTIGSGLSTAIKNAAAGSTICLNAGSYGEFSATVSKSSMVTVKPAGGVSQSQAVLGFVNVATSSNLTFEGLTIAGGDAGSSSAPATHIHWIADAFTSGLCIQTPTSANIDILVEGSTFFNIGEGAGGCGNEGRLEVNGENKGVSGTNGVVISHSSFGRNGCTDGVNITGGGSGTVIGPDDVFENMKEGSCKAHVDPIQFYGAKGTTVTGDYFHGNSDGIMSPDGNGSPMTVTNNVFDTDGEYPWQIVIGGGEHDVISHDTFGHGAMIRIGHVNVGATAANETITDNVLTGGLDLTEGQSSSGWTMEYNLVEGQAFGTHGINGKPTYVGGGSEPSTWTGWALTSSSPGHLAAGDGTNMGAAQFGS